MAILDDYVARRSRARLEKSQSQFAGAQHIEQAHPRIDH